jgi:hypothetical protein
MWTRFDPTSVFERTSLDSLPLRRCRHVLEKYLYTAPACPPSPVESTLEMLRTLLSQQYGPACLGVPGCVYGNICTVVVCFTGVTVIVSEMRSDWATWVHWSNNLFATKIHLLRYSEKQHQQWSIHSLRRDQTNPLLYSSSASQCWTPHWWFIGPTPPADSFWSSTVSCRRPWYHYP